MSDTDAHRPPWVQCNDYRRDVTVAHSYRCEGSGSAGCDLPAWPVDKHRLNTGCCYYPTAELSQRIYGGVCISTRSRRAFRRAWFASERAARRAILRSLTRDALYGGEVHEDVIDNRQTHRSVTWGGGYWD
ncbi:hypothetical protein A5742_11890 [Mycolicibacterium fortuitum]|uniref:Uncharacterized protein n=1 Tax=Mycolicibacterium fortuitum TaxID=1766 RepID=A0ABD6QDJ0_MYCFO|nr:hypothetical protein [Mycolicibacterium fortuitum]OMC35605.1 hypothetical protein A5742_11890 [Mycolicibacterium fortuitum]